MSLMKNYTSFKVNNSEGQVVLNMMKDYIYSGIAKYYIMLISVFVRRILML